MVPRQGNIGEREDVVGGEAGAEPRPVALGVDEGLVCIVHSLNGLRHFSNGFGFANLGVPQDGHDGRPSPLGAGDVARLAHLDGSTLERLEAADMQFDAPLVDGACRDGFRQEVIGAPIVVIIDTCSLCLHNCFRANLKEALPFMVKLKLFGPK